MSDYTSKTTTDHTEIQRWITERDGRPAVVTETESDNSALLRIDFGERGERLREVSWEDFFRIFEENGLAFVYQDELKEGGESRFFKFVRR